MQITETLEDAPQHERSATLFEAVLRYTEHSDETLRCAALRALAAREQASPRARAAALGALLDVDPDVRTDAMDALRKLAKPEDAETIRASLLGDPVREVKEAALAILGQIADPESKQAISLLIEGRSEHDVAWEDEAGTWDEWLEVQAFAIEAAAQTHDASFIPALLDARDGAGGDLDHLVFSAFAGMGEAGAVALMNAVQEETGLSRKRALSALSKSYPASLRPLRASILADESAAVRRLALPLVAAESDDAEQLAFRDPDADLRAEALARFAPSHREWAIRAVRDPSEHVQAAGVRMIAPPLDPAVREALLPNLQAWMFTAGAELAIASSDLLAHTAPSEALDPLLALARNASRPLTARVAAVRAMAGLADERVLVTLQDLLALPAAQVRLMALNCLRERAGEEGADVPAIFVAAISGKLLPPDEDAPQTDTPSPSAPEASDVGAGRGEQAQRTIHISPEGEILELDNPEHAGQSTLAQITRPEANAPHTDGDDAGEPKSRSARRRVAVEGTVDIGSDLRRRAIELCAGLEHLDMEVALLAARKAEDPMIARAAFAALAERARTASTCSAALTACLADGVKSADPDIRARALRGRGAENAAQSLRQFAVSDEDPMVRVAALETLEASGLNGPSACLSDRARPVRATATRMCLAGHLGSVAEAVKRLSEGNDPEHLGVVISSDAGAEAWARAELDAGSRRAALILQALAW
ncbi:MAG: HEAT repeat domain-containing protein [Pseudomonadota bacterium]